MKVSFLGVGAQKAGTSALDTYLGTHPGLCMAKVKEVHLFDDDKTFFKRSVGGYAEYLRQFAPTSTAQLLGEVTPAYMYWNDAPRRIWEYNSAMKLIAVLRSPITRAYSQWNMQRHVGAEQLPFGEALQAEGARLCASLPHQNRNFSYVDRGFYMGQLGRLWSIFPPDQVLILRYEELQRRPNETLGKGVRFSRRRAAAADPAAGSARSTLLRTDVTARVGVSSRPVRVRNPRARADPRVGLRRMASSSGRSRRRRMMRWRACLDR